MRRDGFGDLKKEVLEISDRHPRLSPDNAFVAWFLRAFVVDDESTAVESLTGGAKDKGVDAIHVDHESRTVFIIQGKYHQRRKPVSERRSDVIALGDLGRIILLKDHKGFSALLQDADSIVKTSLEGSRRKLHRRDYRLSLQFITTGKVSKTHREEAMQRVEDWPKAHFEVFDRVDLVRLMRDYIEGAAPPVPTTLLEIHGDQLFNRFDDATGISSWVFTMLGRDLGKLYVDVGDRLFARNIRGYQGKTAVNRSISVTLNTEPDYFWYFNNGVTIICDDARQITERAHRHLRVTNAQIINGQQTVRVLTTQRSSAATLLVRVIVVPREVDVGRERYSHLVSQIVKATNWQNAIDQSDLLSNDIEQVRLERDLRKLGYHYLRKRQSRAEARRITGGRYRYFITKEHMAKCAGACLLDPYFVRLGPRRLFQNDLYAAIFDGRPAPEYLTFYWLVRMAAYFSRGDVRRGYAKWLVVNFIWSQIGKSLRDRRLRENFRFACEREYKYYTQFRPLYSAIKSLFKAASVFYRANRKTRDGVSDESTFFKHKDLHQGFARFWRSAKNKRRGEVKKRLNSFVKHMKEVEP